MLEIFTILPATIPTPAAIGLGLVGLAAGWIWMRAAARHQLDAARRLSASTAVYYARAETARSQLRALEEPTQWLDLTALRAATATPRERLADWAHAKVARIRDLATYEPARRDWAEGEMTETFHRIIDGEDWGHATQSPAALPPPLPQTYEPLAPTLTPTAPAMVAPRGAQAPAPLPVGFVPARRDPAKRLLARQRIWNAELRQVNVPSLLGLRVPPLTVPDFPQMAFQMPQPRAFRSLPHDPRRMAMLPPDPMRKWRRPAVAA